MNMDEILSVFMGRITEVEINKRAAKAVFEREIDLVRKFTKSKYEQEGSDNFYSLSSFYYRNIRTGKVQEYGLKELSLEEHIEQIVLQKNRQYCWLLVEEYEAFENYIKHVYAYIGYNDSDRWVKRDFGKNSVRDAYGKTYDWFLILAKKRGTRHIRERIGKIFRTVAFHERQNVLNIDLRIALMLIEKMRHKIVHCKGVVDSQNDFVKSVLEGCGVWNSGNPNKEYEQFIRQFFGSGAYVNVIVLVEVPISSNHNIEKSYDLYEVLSHCLISYAMLVYECVSEKVINNTREIPGATFGQV